jgi:hypothetical protein
VAAAGKVDSSERLQQEWLRDQTTMVAVANVVDDQMEKVGAVGVTDMRWRARGENTCTPKPMRVPAGALCSCALFLLLSR